MMKYILVCWLLFSSTSWAQSPFTFVFLHKRSDLPPTPKEEVDRIMEGHMANINRLSKEGKLMVAGPFEGGGGIFIFKSNSVEEVKVWLSSDPGVKAQRGISKYYPISRAWETCVPWANRMKW